MRVTVNGQEYEITNMPEFLNDLANRIATNLKSKVQSNIIEMALIDTAEYVTGIDYRVEGDTIKVFSNVEYSHYLEYGTMGGRTKYRNRFLPMDDLRTTKKKNMTPATVELIKRSNYKGMLPFAPFRRLFLRKRPMKRVIKKSLNRV